MIKIRQAKDNGDTKEIVGKIILAEHSGLKLDEVSEHPQTANIQAARTNTKEEEIVKQFLENKNYMTRSIGEIKKSIFGYDREEQYYDILKNLGAVNFSSSGKPEYWGLPDHLILYFLKYDKKNKEEGRKFRHFSTIKKFFGGKIEDKEIRRYLRKAGSEPAFNRDDGSELWSCL